MRGKDESAVCARYDKIASDLANQVRRKRRVDMNKKLEHVKREREILHMRPLRQHREQFGESGTYVRRTVWMWQRHLYMWKKREMLCMHPPRRHRERFGKSGTYRRKDVCVCKRRLCMWKERERKITVCSRYDNIASKLANQVRRKRRVDMNKKLEHVKKEREILHMRPLRQHRERFGESGTWSVVARYDNVASKVAN